MKTVRLCTFETNSSSTHAICMCTAADYEKFKNMELFLHWETLQTAEELYEEFISIYKRDRSTWGEHLENYFKNKLCGQIPSFETFKKALMGTGEWSYVDEDCRAEYTDEEWVIANIRQSFISDSIGNVHNYYISDHYHYETFVDSFNGVVAFGYYGNQ